jgi:hypothetical protein
VTTTNWAARLSVGLIGSALILGFAPSTSAHDVTTSVYSEAYRIQRPVSERMVLSAPPVTIDLPPPVTTMPLIASPVGATTTTTLPRVHTGYSNSMTGRQYRYFERSQEVTALQMELGMRSVDGVYGPKTRKAHVKSLGGPHTLLLQNYPEFGQVLTPCSHGCIPGDGHYELPTLGELINEYFLPEDRALARQIAFCESSGQTHHVGSDVVSDALAVGWFQHLAKYWGERSNKAGWGDYHPFHGRANVAVAAWLFYTSGEHHWNPSKACWGDHL